METARSRRGPRPPVWPWAVLGLVVLAGVAVAGYAAFGQPASKASGKQLHLPSLSQLGRVVERPGPCSARAYPVGAEFTFEWCVSSVTPVGWPRCSQLTYQVDPTNAPAGYGSDVQQAAGDLAAATGLHLVASAGTADIDISWNPALYDPKPGTTGEAGLTDVRSTSGLSGARLTSATIELSSHLTAGSEPGYGEEPVLLHELGHAVGLGHFSGPVVMNPLDRGFTSYQPGDLAGLAYLYHPTSCG
jgi:hypothetical protein